MILVITSSTDYSAFQVIEWIRRFGGIVTIITENSVVNLTEYNLNEDRFTLQIDNQFIKSAQIKSVWFRKIKFQLSSQRINITNDKSLEINLQKFLEYELNTLEEKLNDYFKKNCITLNNNDNIYINKLLQLTTALDVGLKIPETKVITNSSQLHALYSHKKLITKGIFESFRVQTATKYFSSGTDLLEFSEKFDRNCFFPSLVQTYIEKLFEVRAFYIKGTFFAMAIFSQNNSKTMIDFRNYDLAKPNRMVPFILPESVDTKLRKVFEKLEIDSGSADLIVSSDYDFYFLEINPVGQFGFVSGLCNYNLERIIAKHLTVNS